MLLEARSIPGGDDTPVQYMAAREDCTGFLVRRVLDPFRVAAVARSGPTLEGSEMACYRIAPRIRFGRLSLA